MFFVSHMFVPPPFSFGYLLARLGSKSKSGEPPVMKNRVRQNSSNNKIFTKTSVSLRTQEKVIYHRDVFVLLSVH